MAESVAISTWEEARAFRDRLEESGQRLVLTNGCFDVLHVGHVRYLSEARRLGDALCVAINSDASVRALKGPQRPVNVAAHRAEVLLGLKAVDLVVEFADPRATAAIEALRPHCYAKGGDYTLETLDAEERNALSAAGTEIHLLSLVEGQSTTKTLQRLGESEAGGAALRLGVVGSGRGTTLEGLFSAIDDGRLAGVEVVTVVSDVQDARILEIARRRGVMARFIDPGPFKTKFSDDAQESLREVMLSERVDLVVLAGFMRRVKAPLLEAFPDRVLNVHPSMLPEFPGRAAWVQALEAGVSQTGCTVHLVDAGIDSGRILGQEPVPILEGDTESELQRRIQERERQLYPQVIAEYGRSVGPR